MCGIVGFCSCNNKVDRNVLISMRDALSHRGPDDKGEYIDEKNNIGLGHRRLSILDVSTLGHQPMSNDKGTIWVTYNGELYNFKEIRQELIHKGYSFKSNSDTEVLVKAYEQWGIECIHKFIGMFAIAIWDSREKKLYLIRDRAGVKPLYYYHKNDLFLFASELKALHKHPQFPKQLDYSALPTYLMYGFISSPKTIFENTKSVRPGHYICFSNNKIEEVKYWDILDYYEQDKLTASEDEITEELEQILIDSFKYRLVSDVPVGVFLSGGVDSSLVTALLQKNVNTQLKTFSIGFYEDKYNEAHHAKRIADYLGTDHTEYYISEKEALDVVDKLPDIYDEPFGDNSGIPTYLVSKLARKDVTVALSADGGDEVFFGYNRYKKAAYYYDRLNQYPTIIKNLIQKTISNISPDTAEWFYRHLKFLLPEIRGVWDKYSNFQYMLEEGINRNLKNIHKITHAKWREKELDTLFNDSIPFTDDVFDESFNRIGNEDYMSQMLAADFKTYMCDDILTKVDRASMSVSLESREPLLDHRLLEFTARIPSSLKYKNGETKYILKKVLGKYIPRDLWDRPKRGFTSPVFYWLSGDLKPLVSHYLGEEKIKQDGIFCPKTTKLWVDKLYNGYSVKAERIWYLLMFQMWKERWVE